MRNIQHYNIHQMLNWTLVPKKQKAFHKSLIKWTSEHITGINICFRGNENGEIIFVIKVCFLTAYIHWTYLDIPSAWWATLSDASKKNVNLNYVNGHSTLLNLCAILQSCLVPYYIHRTTNHVLSWEFRCCWFLFHS